MRLVDAHRSGYVAALLALTVLIPLTTPKSAWAQRKPAVRISSQ